MNFRPTVEALENRLTPRAHHLPPPPTVQPPHLDQPADLIAHEFKPLSAASGITLENGVLTVRGDDKANFLIIEDQGNGTVAARLSLDANFPPTSKTFAKADVKSILIDGYGGDDTLENFSSLPSVLFGGAGEDYVFGGLGADQIWTGSGYFVAYAAYNGTWVAGDFINGVQAIVSYGTPPPL